MKELDSVVRVWAADYYLALMREARPLDPPQDGEFGAGAFRKC